MQGIFSEFLIGIGILASIGEGFEQYRAEQSQLQGMKLQNDETQIQYGQKTLQNISNLNNLLASQTAAETVRGVSLSSPSFNAIQRNTFNTSMKEQKNLDTEEDLENENYNIEKGMVKTSLWGQLFGDAANAASDANSFYQSKPSKA